MRSFPTACLTRRVCGREVVPGAAVCQGSIPRVPGVHHRRGLPHANALPRRHHSQVRDMGHGRTGKKVVSKLENTSNLKPFLCGTWPTFLLFPSLFARIYSCWAPSCENVAKESIRWKSFTWRKFETMTILCIQLAHSYRNFNATWTLLSRYFAETPSLR